MRPEVRDTIKKLPKLRGHGKNRSRTINPTKIRPMPVNLARLDKAFADGDKVTPSTLSRVGLIRGRGHMTVKILGTGSLNKKLSVTGCMVSASARKGIEDAGGTVVA
jgi:large subunit ribosomal protein L15